MAELTEESVEAVQEVFKDTVRNPASWFWSGVFAGATVGLSTGLLIARHYLEKKYAARAEKEIDQMREHFRKRLIARDEKKPDLNDLNKVVEDLKYDTEELRARQELKPAPGEPNVPDAPEVHNVFEDPENGWDYKIELENRTEDRPYVIHIDERKEADFEEIRLIYYDGDDVLCDTNDRVIEDRDKVVGINNLLMWGHGSGDPEVIYIRNPVLSLDIEVNKNDASFAEEVHGFKHEDPPRRRRSRSDE